MILVFGKTGQVAMELQRLLPEARFLGRDEADLTDPLACGRKIRDLKPAAVINAAAYTAVDKAEDDALVATLVNAAAPTEMAETCADLGIPFVHISTDYVFDGAGEEPFAPDHPTGPLGVYGETKLEGENGVREAGGVFAILRTSWVFSAHGGNFVKTMLRLAETRDKLTVVVDQIGGPTPARDIAKACVETAEQLKTDPNKAGTYHFSGSPDMSWADFAREIFAQAGSVVEVEDIPTSAYPTPAKRPANSRLDCSTTETTFGIRRPDWKAGLAEVLSELEIRP
ncbi:dTDP-4-dehydrorhamnose reductase [Celeribacter persicus]|uniref:dTDP-4-dehydrorhamnose reductase n=1 Tax=Celeribacter persicus TaxID=1651082 RepID=A0A2T5HDY4_9RHOB|nr:dTDP-4-dehydrorhamnose reductase [Celeribacter persicus]PTQ69766.1 dTDP-4-dehydrorhamnose reductase [Celeribacter persicus]